MGLPVMERNECAQPLITQRELPSGAEVVKSKPACYPSWLVPPPSTMPYSSRCCGQSFFHQQVSYPIAVCTSYNRFPLPIFQSHAHTARKKLFDDRLLRILGLFRTASASSSGLHGQMKGRRPSLVSDRRVASCVEQAPHCADAASTDSSMKGCGPVFVLCVYICSYLQQASNHLHLTFFIPSRTMM